MQLSHRADPLKPSDSLRILLIDDDKDLVDLLAYATKRAGLYPLVAFDASTAVRLFYDEQPDLVVLDLLLGEDNGLDELKAVRQRSQTPVLVLSDFSSEEMKVRALDFGADDYMSKPFSHRELIARIRAQLRRSAHELQARRVATQLKVGFDRA